LIACVLASCGTAVDGTDGGQLPTGDGGESVGDGGASGDAGTTPDPVTTATLTLDGTTTTVTPNLRRGFAFTPPTGTRNEGRAYGSAIPLTCAPGAASAAGGRVISIHSATVSGNVTGNCNINHQQIPGAEDQIEARARTECAGRSSCDFNPTSTVDTYLFDCQPSNFTISVTFTCRALDPAPHFVLETTTPALVLSAMDGLGTSTCADRNAALYIDGGPAALMDGAPCNIEITKRTERTIAGTVTATLAGLPPRPLSITFEHDLNVFRPVVGFHTGADVCASNQATIVSRTEGDETIDDISATSFQCQLDQSRAPTSMSLQRRRLRAGSTAPQENGCGSGARFNAVIERASTAPVSSSGCASVTPVAETALVTQFVMHESLLCPAGGGAGCYTLPVIYVSLGTGDAAAPVPNP